MKFSKYIGVVLLMESPDPADSWSWY